MRSVAEVAALLDHRLAEYERQAATDHSTIVAARLQHLRFLSRWLHESGLPTRDRERVELSLVPFLFQEANYDDIRWSTRGAPLHQMEGDFELDFLIWSGGSSRGEVSPEVFARYVAEGHEAIRRRFPSPSEEPSREALRYAPGVLLALGGLAFGSLAAGLAGAALIGLNLLRDL